MFSFSKIICYAALVSFATTGSILVGPSVGLAEELKLAHFMSPNHPMDRFFMRPWSEEIAKITNNGLTVRIYPAGELGAGPQAQFQRAADGIADIAFGLQGYTSRQFPRTALIELPAVAAAAVEATNRLWDVYEKYLVPEYGRVKVLALWVGDGPILMTKDKPIRAIQDIKGLKIRTPSKAQANLIRALGATPVAMPATDMYHALTTGVVDALMVPPSVITSFKIAEVAKYYTTGLPFGHSPFFLVMNKKSYEALSPEHKAAIDKTAGRGLSVRGATIYEEAGARALNGVRSSGKHEVIALSPEEVKKGTELLLKVRGEVVAELEKEGVPAKAVLAAMGAGK